VAVRSAGHGGGDGGDRRLLDAGDAKGLILSWLEAVLKRREPLKGTALRRINQRDGWLAFFKTQPIETTDGFGLSTFEIAAVKIEKIESGRIAHQGWQPASWLPNHVVAKEWLAFVQQKSHPILPLN
jgi:hypothetical protein